MPHAGATGLLVLAELMRDDILRPSTWSGVELTLGASIGIAPPTVIGLSVDSSGVPARPGAAGGTDVLAVVAGWRVASLWLA